MKRRRKATGTCYQTAAQALLYDPQFTGWTMVHGRPTLSVAPYIEFGHAWLESPDGETVYDAELRQKVPLVFYYAVGRIKPANSNRYTREQAVAMMLHYLHYGPWEGVEAVGPVRRRRNPTAREENQAGAVVITTNSEGRRIAKTDAEIAAFWRWFGASKVVDDEGRPLVVYHHGYFNADEDPVFRVKKGAHFGTKRAAEDRAGAKAVDDFIEEGVIEHDEERGRWYWSSQGIDSFDLNEDGFETKEDARVGLEGFAQQEEPSYDGENSGIITEVYLKIEAPHSTGDMKADWSPAIAAAKKLGKDGVRYRNNHEHKGSVSWLVWNPRQIKSATGNRGTFDPEDPSINNPRRNPMYGEKENDALFLETIANRQRYHSENDPEERMLKINFFHVGVLSNVVEHGGDLMWRMTEKGAFTDYGRESVIDKIDRVTRALTRAYGFVREHEQNIVNNVKHKEPPITEAEYRTKLDHLLTKYAEAHAKLPIYNLAHYLARSVAVAIGEQQWHEAVALMRHLRRLAENREKWMEVAGSIDPNYAKHNTRRNPALRSNPGPGLRIAKQRRLAVPGDATVYTVDGSAVRKKRTDWIGGSHYYADRFIPEGEIWIERMRSKKEERFLLAHEMTERLLMKYLRFNYKKGHAAATVVEQKLRKDRLAPVVVFLQFLTKFWPTAPAQQRLKGANAIAKAYRGYK